MVNPVETALWWRRWNVYRGKSWIDSSVWKEGNVYRAKCCIDSSVVKEGMVKKYIDTFYNHMRYLEIPQRSVYTNQYLTPQTL